MILAELVLSKTHWLGLLGVAVFFGSLVAWQLYLDHKQHPKPMSDECRHNQRKKAA